MKVKSRHTEWANYCVQLATRGVPKIPSPPLLHSREWERALVVFFHLAGQIWDGGIVVASSASARGVGLLHNSITGTVEVTMGMPCMTNS